MSTNISNYDVYNERMNKTMEDKTWWLNEVAADEKVKFIVDFGCGDGALFRYVESKYPGRFRYIGIENDAEMRRRAAETKGLAWSIAKDIKGFEERVEKSLEFHYENAIVVCNSVIHEVYSYSGHLELFTFWEFIGKNNFHYIAIRDMIMAEGGLDDKEAWDMVAAIKDSSYANTFLDYWCFSKTSIRSVYTFIRSKSFWNEFFLKYRYKENWEREKKETYQWDWFKDFLVNVDFGNTMLTVQKFQIPWQREKIKEDFGIDWIVDTHMKILLRRD